MDNDTDKKEYEMLKNLNDMLIKFNTDKKGVKEKTTMKMKNKMFG